MNKKAELNFLAILPVIAMMTIILATGFFVYVAVSDSFKGEKICERNDMEYVTKNCGFSCLEHYCVDEDGIMRELVKNYKGKFILTKSGG